ncbi:MAG: ribbon-helix-helix protein, CopG family [Cyanobacteria bacterium K_Offshore_surface_m2_011]|nr:ribbon-helix-helix protein, CopG family [Cyanobacteria bacterium K_Offshore_surface_m2_011]
MQESLLTIWLDEALEQQLEAACTETRRSRSEIVREALRRQLSLWRVEHLRGQALSAERWPRGGRAHPSCERVVVHPRLLTPWPRCAATC